MSNLPVCLFVLCVASVALRNVRMLGTSIILLANWTINTLVVQWTGDPYPWAWFLITDYLSGFVVLIVGGRPKAWQVIVTITYALECVMHGAYGLSVRGPWQIYYYWQSLHYTAWAQMWLIAGWGVADLAGRLGVSGRGASPANAGVAGSERRGPPEP